jgi:type II secretory ATPase GspE/PulE/Tfp pilus assembly ATPase PilB-like protein
LQIADWDQFAICDLQFAIGLAVVLLSPAAAGAAGETSFPRGPGLYFSLAKLTVLLAIYFLWVKTCAWVDRDAHALGLPAAIVWNPLLWGCGLAGLLVVWLLPVFFVSFLALVTLYLVPTLAYVNLRNQRVAADRRVLTERHLDRLVRRFLGHRGRVRPNGREAEDRAAAVRFTGGRSDRLDEDPGRVARAEGLRGCKGARRLVAEAVRKRAAEIHLEPAGMGVAVRFRIDGVLQAADPYSRERGEGVIKVFKTLAGLDRGDRRRPQDGNFSGEVAGRDLDFRVSTRAGRAGERVEVRLRDRSRRPLSLARLGLREGMPEQVHQLVNEPRGLFLVCGPAGAGKTTTLYACLAEIDPFQKDIITVETAVETRLPNITQVEVNLRGGDTLPAEVRAVLRQEPDVLGIGEIRDKETAELALQIAKAGPPVLATFLADDAAAALERLLGLGVPGALVAAAVNAVLGQRLVRVLCPRCKVRYRPRPEALRKANLLAPAVEHFYRPPEAEDRRRRAGEEGPVVCRRCGGTGYRGQTGIFELLVVNERIRELLRRRKRPNFYAIRQEAAKGGMHYLQGDGIRQVMEGKTSIRELLRVCK